MGRGPARFPGKRFNFVTLSDIYCGIFPDLVLCVCFASLRLPRATAVLLCFLVRPWPYFGSNRAPLGPLGHLLGTFGPLLASFWSLLGLFWVSLEPLGALLEGDRSWTTFFITFGPPFSRQK